MGLFDNIKNNPDLPLALMAIGQGMGQLDAGQAPNMMPGMMMMHERQQDRKRQESINAAMEGLRGRLTPEQMRTLTALPPQIGARLVAQVLMQDMQPPDPMADLNRRYKEAQIAQMTAPAELDAWEKQYNLYRRQEIEAERVPSSFFEYKKAIEQSGAPSVSQTLNAGDMPDARPLVGQPAQGIQRRWDPDRQSWVDEPIPGGEADIERQQAEEKETQARREKGVAGHVVKKQIAKLRQLIDKKDRGVLDLPETGIFGNALVGLNQEATDVDALLTSIKGFVAIDKLKEMKRLSATGASGFGALNTAELELLMAQLGALDQRTDKTLILDTLDTIESVLGNLTPEAQVFLFGDSSYGTPDAGNPLNRQQRDNALKKKYGLD